MKGLSGISARAVFFLVALLCLSHSAWGASASVTASVRGDGSVVATASGSFASCRYCVRYDPDGTCAEHETRNWGSAALYLGSVSYYPYCWDAGNGSASCSETFDRCSLHGSHDFIGRASDCTETVYQYYTLTLDNTPTISVSEPTGTIDEPFDIVGTANFQPTLRSTKGTITVYINGNYVGSKTCTTETCDYSYREMTGQLYDMNDGGPYTVMMRASGCGASATDSKTFTVDKQCEVSVATPSGTVESPFDISGIAAFKPTLSDTKGTLFAYLNGGIIGGRSCTSESCYFSYEELTGRLYSMGAGGPYTVMMRCNGGGTTAQDSKTFTVAGCVDNDHDGYFASSDNCATGNDCNDDDPSIHPGVAEICDSRDNNCNGEVDEGLSTDADGDGHFTLGSCEVPNDDCNDGDSSIHPGAVEVCDGKDNNCNGQVDEGFDMDGDGYKTCTGDCNDGNPAIHPGAAEICDRLDNNCNGQVDEGLSTDADGDGHYTYSSCATPNDDCDDDDRDRTTNCFNIPQNGLQQCTGSSNNVATGELSHGQSLFSSRSSVMPIGVDLTYKSRSTYIGPLGRGWRHSYDMALSDGGNHARFWDGSGDSRLYNLTGGVYVTAAGDYSTLVKNADNTYTVTEKDGLKYNFGVDGKITSIVDRNGLLMTFTYTNGNLSFVTDPAGRTATFLYDANNRISDILDPNGNIFGFIYTDDLLTSVTYPDGGSWEYTYDSSGYMITKTNPNLKTVGYTYDPYHRLLTSRDPEERTRSFTYPVSTNAERSTTFVEKDGGIWTKTYDITKGLLKSKTDPLGNTTGYTYDANGNMLTKTEPGNITTSYTYDSNGNMLTATNPLNETTTYTYNSRGQVLTATDARGTMTSTYDVNGNLTSVTDLSGVTTTYAYDSSGRVTGITNGLNQTTIFVYDATTGDLASTTDITGATTTFTYDANGNMITQTNSAGTTTFEYDGMNRLTKITDPAGNMTTNTYDKMGNLIFVKDANGNTTTNEYNYKGQVTKVTDALGNVTTYNYSGSGCSSCGGGVDKLTSLTDAKGQKTSYTYDLLGRLTTETDPLNKVISYSYDTHGNMVSKTDANGQTITYAYDALNRLTQKRYPDQTTETYTYDNKGYLISVANSNITYNMIYDAAGRVSTVTDSRGNTIAYEYNTIGQKTKATYPGNKIINYSYDAVNQLQGITSDAGAFTITYDSLGRRTKLTYPNGTAADYSYDTIGRLTSLINKITGGAEITSASYTYDSVGNRLTKGGTTNESYTYDAIYRLTQATKAKESESYTYDAVGNRLTGPGAKDADYAYSAANQMTRGRKINFSYDDNGNQTAREEE